MMLEKHLDFPGQFHQAAWGSLSNARKDIAFLRTMLDSGFSLICRMFFLSNYLISSGGTAPAKRMGIVGGALSNNLTNGEDY